MENIVYSYYPRPYNIVYKECEKRMPFHMHNEIEIILCETGGLNIAAGSSTADIRGKYLIFLPTSCVHRIITGEEEPQRRYILTISPTWLYSVLGRDNRFIINSSEPRLISISDEDMERLESLFGLYARSGGLKKLSLLFDILNEYEIILGRENYPTNSPVSGILRYINENLSHELRVGTIAREFYFNPDYMCRIFKKHMNMTLTEYINLQRVSAAREMLDSGADIKTVQNETGFNSYSHFARTFKKYMELTPKQYKNKTYYFDSAD